MSKCIRARVSKCSHNDKKLGLLEPAYCLLRFLKYIAIQVIFFSFLVGIPFITLLVGYVNGYRF